MLLSAGAIAGTPDQWEALRIKQGRPAPGQELTDDDNPLEAGLWQSISFEKGCYFGQETIARLNTYKGVKKRLWGLKLSEEVSPGAAILAAGAKIGRVTSVTEAASEVIGLGYLRTKAGGAGLTVEVERAEGQMIAAEAIALPFISHEYYEPKAAAPSQSMSPPVSQS
jgi:folate-binding protein YgfZ